MADDAPAGLQAVSAHPLRAAASGAVGVVVVSLLVGALIFSNSLAAQRVADDARILHQAEATLGANNLAVKALSQAVLLAEDKDLGVADEETCEAAIAEASRTLNDLTESSDAVLVELGEAPEFQEAARIALSAGTQVLLLLADEQVEAAGDLLAGDAKLAFEELRDEAGIHRDQAAEAVASTTDLISRVGNLPAFFAAFLVPALAILAYRRIVRGQLRLAEVQLDARLESEQQIARAKDEFVTNISHELRTPLTSIYGFSELLLEQGLVDPDLSLELLAMINTESAELHRMVEDLLTSARHEGGTLTIKPTTIDLPSNVEAEVVKLGQAGKHVEIDCVAKEAWADDTRVRQILRNLVSNAQRYGGENIRVVCERLGDHVAVVVSDDGVGVEPSKVARLFTRYVHDGASPLTVGSIGLGLSVVRMLAEAMGGDANYQREDGWSRFVVRLPLNEQASISSRLPHARNGSLPPHVAAAAVNEGLAIQARAEGPAFEVV